MKQNATLNNINKPCKMRIFFDLLKGKKAKNLIENYCNKNNKNKTEINLQFLQKISGSVIDYESIRSAINPKTDQKSKLKVASTKNGKEKVTAEEESIFTEKSLKDFKKTHFRK